MTRIVETRSPIREIHAIGGKKSGEAKLGAIALGIDAM